MNWQLWTRRFIFAIVVIIGLYDIAAIVFGGHAASVSEQVFGMTGEGVRHVTLIFVFGYLMGHMIGRLDK